MHSKPTLNNKTPEPNQSTKQATSFSGVAGGSFGESPSTSKEAFEAGPMGTRDDSHQRSIYNYYSAVMDSLLGSSVIIGTIQRILAWPMFYTTLQSGSQQYKRDSHALYTYTYAYISIHIHTYVELSIPLSLCIYIYIYIVIYTRFALSLSLYSVCVYIYIYI